MTSFERGRRLDSCAFRNARVSSTTAAATAGVNSGNTVGAIVNSSGSLTSSQERKKRISLARASGVASTWSTGSATSSALGRSAGVADDRPTVSGGASASV